MESPKDRRARLRLRELSRYYCATAHLPQPDLKYDGRPGLDAAFVPAKPALSTDHLLTGLAQLAALRLKCDRAFISIIDEHNQHIIAEATRTISPFDQNDHEPGDAIIVGAQTVPLSSGLCPPSLAIFSGFGQPAFQSSAAQADENHVCIPDLLHEPRISSASASRMFPLMLRYYLEVPLRSVSGYAVGSICVADSTVRAPNTKDIAALQRMSDLVVQHLGRIRLKEDHGRAERILEGLGHFIQGKNSLSAWSKETAGQDDIPDAYRMSSQLASIDFMRDVANSESSPGTATSEILATASPSAPQLTPSVSSVSAVTTPATSTGPSLTEAPRKLALGVDPTDFHVGYDQEPANDKRRSATASFKVSQTFSRAANLLRESMDLDATSFLEIPQNERFRNNRRSKPSPKRDADKPSSMSSPVTSGDTDQSTDTSGDAALDPQTTAGRVSTPYAADADCRRLGYASRTSSSLAGSETSHGFLTIPASLLARLSTKYPRGHIFTFDSLGAISSEEERREGSTEASQNSARPNSLSTKLYKLFPSAASMIFLPLYDNERQQVYAGFLGWTTDPSRGLLKNEKVFVSGFADSVMCEVMRLEALATDKAKSDFISSISHELRSPLHGVLAASQLLSEAPTSPKQMEFLQMIDTCARTLLDTMNHLLDHAKINNLTQERVRRHRRAVPKAIDSKDLSEITRLNLLSVVEETVVSMAASSKQLLRKHGRTDSGLSPLHDRSASLDQDDTLSIPIILNITKQDWWTIQSEPGSWRRIIMNLIGNSLKYTQTGHVSVSLACRDARKSGGRGVAELKVSDTGQGISEEYLKHRLFTPFAQENNLSVGAGLGLSLVQKIVSSLGGQIEVHSEVGTGTEILVKVPLDISDHAQRVENLGMADNEELLARTRGRTFQFLGFDDRPSLHEQSTGIPSPRTRALIEMQASLTNTLTTWFGMRAAATEAEICIIEERLLRSELDTYDHKNHRLLVVGLDGRNNIVDRLQQASSAYLLPPAGPNRIAQVLLELLNFNEQLQGKVDIQDSPMQSVPARPKLSSAISNGSGDSFFPTINPLTGSWESLQTDSVATLTPAGYQTPATPATEAVLLVDDNDINLRILVASVSKLGLEKRGISCLTAVNGKEALDKYIAAVSAGTRISMIFMDISMPVMDGFTATRRIREYEKSRGMRREWRSKIIALTGLASAEAQSEVEGAGFNLYLRKPATIARIRAILEDDGVRDMPDQKYVGSPAITPEV
ncbi:uncharacterized protein HMPREF1541_05075 [Cyphellophora europaea CBS 101466]|uniref:Histidine kinase n=1 Tax=Cyphellophora europaea (strain CBS 101466) TaxID=1220924 RepID=W2RWT2_CYPE1|nr:uncharacterized protein HMPREF1541_05075 [Cyphellophora europaea CBS 101466]ETN40795.1 hypothetical protein HMPREF1541_05075 [Cyphellophora europaea CBS 101466]